MLLYGNKGATTLKNAESPTITTDSSTVVVTAITQTIRHKCKNYEQRSNEMTHKVCKFIKENGRNPIPVSKDKNEKLLGAWLANRKSAKKGKGTVRFYNSDQEIAENYELYDLFENNREKESNETTHKVCRFIKENGRNPSTKSKDENEKILGYWLRNKKLAKKGTNSATFYNSDQEIAENYKLYDLFETTDQIDKESKSNEMTNNVCNFIKKNGRNPTAVSKDKNEKMLGVWLRNRKSTKKGNTSGRFYESDQIIAESFGYKNLFSS